MFSIRATDSQHIYATPWHIWRVLTSFDGYARWNPLLPQVQGKAQENASIKLKFRALSKRPLPYLGQIVKFMPYQGLALRCQLAGVPFILDISLAAYIDPLDKVSSKCTLGLRARGILVPLLEPLLDKHLMTGLGRMNYLIKALAESAAPGA